MDQKKTIIDVRTEAEFLSGNVPGSINIPMNELMENIERIQEMEQPIILCCASGARSSRAAEILNGYGVSCENGGSWLNLYFE